MANRRIAATVMSDMAPLGSAGQRSYEMVTREVGRALGPEHAALFAEPVPSPDGHAVDWYTPFDGRAEPLERLDDERREAVKARLGELVGGVLAHAETLEKSSDQKEQRLGAALRNAAEIPDESHIYAVGDQPVVTCWAHHLNVREPRRGVLSRLVPAPVRPTPSVVPAAVAATPVVTPVAVAGAPAAGFAWASLLWWLTWLAILLMTAAILWHLTYACGLAGPGWLDRCPGTAAAAPLDDLRDDRAALENELRHVERSLRLAELDCLPRRVEAPPPPAPPPVEEPVEEPSADEFDERVEEADGETDAALMVTLLWDDNDDVDLALICPSGRKIWWRNPIGCGSGRLDVDRNADRTVAEPVENIVFGEDAPPGRYIIEVRNFRSRGSGPVPFRVRVRSGARALRFEGTLSGRGDVETFEFTLPLS